jgi:hypothetical protein
VNQVQHKLRRTAPPIKETQNPLEATRVTPALPFNLRVKVSCAPVLSLRMIQFNTFYATNEVLLIYCCNSWAFLFTVDILLKATGDAPIIKQKKWTVDQSKKIAYVVAFVKKLLKIKPQESLVSVCIKSFSCTRAHQLVL